MLKSNLLAAGKIALGAVLCADGFETTAVIATAAGIATTFCDDDDDDEDDEDDEDDDDDAEVPVKSRYADPDPPCRTGAL